MIVLAGRRSPRTAVCRFPPMRARRLFHARVLQLDTELLTTWLIVPLSSCVSLQVGATERNDHLCERRRSAGWTLTRGWS